MPVDHPVIGTVRRADLAAHVAALGFPQRDAAGLVSVVLDEITDALCDRERVTLTGFGRFEVVRRAPRAARDLASGASVRVPERLSVAFRPAPALCAALDASLGLVEREP